jgi:outer membrane protein OmpA-like peptidoglycan-associated protein
MRGKFRLTVWIAFADFFTALALISFALYASNRSRANECLQLQADVRRLAKHLRDELQGAGVPAQTREADLAIVLPSILFFNSGKAQINDSSNLTKVAIALKRVRSDWRDNFVLVIQGYTDSRPPLNGAPFRDNLELSRWRAQAVEQNLIDNGISAPFFQIVSQGMGPQNPIVNNCVDGRRIDCSSLNNYRQSEDLEQNRRIELKFGIFTGNCEPVIPSTNSRLTGGNFGPSLSTLSRALGSDIGFLQVLSAASPR